MKIENISIDKIGVDYSYQRPTNLQRLKNKNKGKKFDLSLLGVLTVSRRSNGTNWALDGATRLAWAAENGVLKVPCIVEEGLTIPEEARKFQELNKGRVAVKGNETFKAALREKDKTAVLVATLAKLAGWTLVYKGAGAGQIEIGHSLTQYLRPQAKDSFSEEIIKTALGIAYRAWSKEKDGGQLRVIRPIMTFLKQGLGKGIDLDTMVARLDIVLPRMTAFDLKHACVGGNCYLAGARFLAGKYNHKLPEEKRFPVSSDV